LQVGEEHAPQDLYLTMPVSIHKLFIFVNPHTNRPAGAAQLAKPVLADWCGGKAPDKNGSNAALWPKKTVKTFMF